MEFVKLIDWQPLLITAVIATIIVSALNTVQTKVSSNWLVFIVSFVVTLLNTTFEGESFADWQKIGSQLLFTMAFSVLFYNYLGKFFVDDLFAWLKKVIQSKFGGDEPPKQDTPQAQP